MTETGLPTCPACAHVGDAGDLFCETCGTELVGTEGTSVTPASCPTCGEDAGPLLDGYCRSCGRRLPSRRDRLEAVEGDGRIAAMTHRGRRSRNEDAFAIATTDDRVVAAISDGVSTTAGSDKASLEAVEAAVEALRANGNAGVPDALRDAYTAARDAVNRLGGNGHDVPSPPACPFLALSAALQQVDLVSVGDCRAFWLPDEGDPKTLTEDDSWAAEQVTAGTMTVDQAHADPRSHGITRWLGGDADPSWAPRHVSFSAHGPGRVVLCSDGLWNYAPSADQVATAAGVGTPAATARRLVDYANECGGRDNTTVVVVSIAGPATSPPKGSAS